MAGSAQRGKWNNGKYRQWRKYSKHMQRVGKWKFRDDGYLNCYLIKFFFGQQKVCLFLTRILFEWLKILKTTSALGPFMHSTCCIQKAVMDWREIDSQMWICGSFWKSFNLCDWQSVIRLIWKFPGRIFTIKKVIAVTAVMNYHPGLQHLYILEDISQMDNSLKTQRKVFNLL